MTITPGTRLGPYEILSPLGAGGMGEVWRARDTRLDRSVAVKILPAALAQNAQLRVRFEREARAISQLNHPHICTVHDVGKEDGVDYLVMELIEGESLAERLSRGALPLAEVVRYGVQIAEALDRAHRAGIVHRDLKPGNVMLTKAGAKLLDFGLARSAATPVSSPDTPTEHMPLTAEGTIVGTFQYMAPEQLAGDEADTRTDIFALGAVLYEMVTGRRAFQGKNKTSLIASIIGQEPPRISDVQPLTPPALEHLIARCLAKDPEDRWQSAHDIAQELRWIGEAGSQAGVAAPLTAKRKNRERIFAASTLLLAVATILLAWALWRQRPEPPRVQRSSIVPPRGQRFALSESESSALTIAPNGRYATFAAVDYVGGSPLYLYDFESGESRQIGRGSAPFWSPDSKSIAFYEGNKLKRVEVSGGPAVSITDADEGRGGTWSADGTIIFTPSWRNPLHKVSANGGPATPITKLDTALGETTHRWPWFLPDGKHFLYLAGSHKTAPDSDVNAIYIGSIDSPERTLLLRARSNAIYANGHVLFVRENYLMAQPFDARKRKLTGDPIRIAHDVTTVPGFFRAQFGASNDGKLVYFTGPAEGKREIKWFDLDFKEIQNVASLALRGFVRLSPDDRRAAVSVGDPSDVWIIDLDRLTKTRVTTDPMQDLGAVWAPDGSQIAYTSDKNALGEIYVRQIDGPPAERLLLRDPQRGYAEPTAWSPDGKYILADTEGKGGEEPDIWVVPTDGSKPFPLIKTDFADHGATFSHDGRWVLYLSDESGRQELHVVSFPDARIKKQLTEGGVYGGWWNGPDTIGYVTHQLDFMRIAVKGDAFGLPEPIGKVPEQIINFDVARDGKRLLAIEEEEIDPVPITVVNHWTRLLAER